MGEGKESKTDGCRNDYAVCKWIQNLLMGCEIVILTIHLSTVLDGSLGYQFKKKIKYDLIYRIRRGRQEFLTNADLLRGQNFKQWRCGTKSET